MEDNPGMRSTNTKHSTPKAQVEQQYCSLLLTGPWAVPVVLLWSAFAGVTWLMCLWLPVDLEAVVPTPAEPAHRWGMWLAVV